MAEKRKTRKEEVVKVAISPPFEKVYNIPFLKLKIESFPKGGEMATFTTPPISLTSSVFLPLFSPKFSLPTEKLVFFFTTPL